MLEQFAFISGDWITDAIITTTIVVFIFFSAREFSAVLMSKKLLAEIAAIKP